MPGASLAPFVTAVNHVPTLKAHEVGLNTHPEASVDCLPGVASYVGADISAGVLSSGLDDTEDVTIQTQDAVLSTFSQIMTALTMALGGIAAISLSVAGVGIMNVMLVSVSERTSEIGLLKALGGSPGQVQLVFLIEAAVLSTLGGLLGLAVGIGSGRIFSVFVPAFPVESPTWAVLGSLLLSVALGILFGALPARRAARLDPVTALAGR